MSALGKTFAAIALLAGAALAVAACAGPRSAACRHPEELREAPTCSACHEKGECPPLDHDAAWVRTHGAAARQNARTCELCHRPSFCADCHGAKEEMKPSDKWGNRPDLVLPHRGDYINQHKVDGRIDPAACFSCHGRKNDWRCSQCHR
jgi:hypothetical protein